MSSSSKSEQTDPLPAASWIDWHLESAEEKYRKARAEFSETFELNPKYATEWKLAPVLEAQALYEISLEVIEEADTWEEGLERFKSSVERALTHTRTDSFSTSAATNLADRVEEGVRLRFYGKVLEAEAAAQRLAARDADE